MLWRLYGIAAWHVALTLVLALVATRQPGLLFQGTLGDWHRLPKVRCQIGMGFDDFYAFALKQFALQGRVGFADEQFSAVADNAVPRDAFSRWGRCHSPARGSRPAAQSQSLGKRPIGSNPSARN